MSNSEAVKKAEQAQGRALKAANFAEDDAVKFLAQAVALLAEAVAGIAQRQ